MGRGTTLRVNGDITEYWWTRWYTKDACQMRVVTAQARHQTFREALALLLSMIIWRKFFNQGLVLIVGDNVPSLQTTMNLKGARTITGNIQRNRPAKKQGSDGSTM